MNAEQLRANGWVETESGNWIKGSDTLSGRGCQVMKAVEVIKPRKRIRQSSKPLLNKLEEEWLAQLKLQQPNVPVFAQAVRFRLTLGTVYTPDFFAFDWPAIGELSRPTAWESKGSFFPDDAKKSLKMFATIYQQVRVILCWKENGQWRTQRILA